jgi:hypothetical protein
METEYLIATVTGPKGAWVNSHSSHVGQYAIAKALRQAYDRWVVCGDRHSVEVRKQGAKPWEYTRIEFSGPTPEGDVWVRQRQYQWEFVECYFWPEARKASIIASQPVAQL